MDVKLGFILDKPNQFLNRGSNILMLGETEYRAGLEKTNRIYVMDSNGDMVEIEDDVTDVLENFKSKIVKVTENLPTEDFKPKIIYLVKSDSNGTQTFNDGVIKNIYQYYNNNKDKIKPYYMNTNILGVTHKLIPYIDERVVFGILEGDKIEDLTTMFISLTNLLLKNSDYIFTRLQNLLVKYNLNISKAYQEISNAVRDFDELIIKSINVFLEVNRLSEKTDSILSEFGCYDMMYTTTKFVNGNADRFSTLDFSSKNNNDWNTEPFVDIVVIALQGNSIIKYCSFRVDKRTRSISNFYGDSTHFYFENIDGYPTLPLHVKNRYTYKIMTNWNLNLADRTLSKILPKNYSTGFTGVTNEVQLNDLVILSNGKPCKIEMSLDNKGGRILSTIDTSSGSELSSIRSELTSPPDGRYMKLIDGNLIGFFELTEERKRPGVQPTFYDLNVNKTFYIKHTDKFPIYNQVRFNCNTWSAKGNAGTRLVVFYDKDGREFFRIRKDPVFGSWATDVIYNIPESPYISKIYFERYIDTRSHGGAHLNVDISSIKTGWRNIIRNAWYRTGNGWEGVTYNVNVKPEE